MHIGHELLGGERPVPAQNAFQDGAAWIRDAISMLSENVDHLGDGRHLVYGVT